MCPSRITSTVVLTHSSVPFFYEPNFDAVIKPLPAALRIQDGQSKTEGASKVNKTYDSVVYGDFLVGKVVGNFDKSAGKYN